MCVRIVIAGGGNGTFLTAGRSGFAVFPTEQYSAVAEVIGFLRRKQLAQLIFHLCRIFSGGEPQQVGNADAVGVAYDGGLVVVQQDPPMRNPPGSGTSDTNPWLQYSPGHRCTGQPAGWKSAAHGAFHSPANRSHQDIPA